jgi:hypothetical protein
MGTQFYGKDTSKFCMVKVPTSVKRAAQLAFVLRDNHAFIGAKETGWKRANQLVTCEAIPLEDVRFMRNWYARHVYTSFPGYTSWINEGKPLSWTKKRSILSWLTWGGDAGRKWINSKNVLKLLNDNFGTSYSRV